MTGFWAEAAAAALGWRSVVVEPLTGSTSGERVVRVRAGAESAVLKRFDAADLGLARLAGRLPDAPFARVVGESPPHRVLAFADLGTGTLDQRFGDHPAGRRAAAEHYVRAVEAAGAALAAFGTPPPVAPHVSLDAFLGFAALTPSARDLATPTGQLTAIAGHTRDEPPPAPALAAARRADADLAGRLAGLLDRRRWILQDVNPSNLVLTEDGAARWVDVLPAAGLPETSLLALPGSHFRLDEPTMLDVLAAAGVVADPVLLRTLNGLYSVFTLCDTVCGLADGSRNGLVHSGLDYRDNEKFSLGLAAELLADGLAEATGYLPFVEWLAAVPPTRGLA